MIDKDEISLLNLIKNGDKHAFELIFRRYYSNLCDFVVRYTKDMDYAEELVQDMFFNFWRKRESITVQTSLKSYLMTSVKNNFLQDIRRKKQSDKYSSYLKLNHQDISSDDASNEVKVNELNERIAETLNALPDRCKEIFKLSRYEGLKYHEIAEKLKISVKTVEANMGKALRSFRESLKDYVEVASIILLMIIANIL